MRPSVHLPDPFAGHVRVQLGRADAGMSEELLDDPKVRPTLQQMGRKGMAQGVWADPASEPGASRRPLHGSPGLLPGQSPAAITDKERTAADRGDVMALHDHRSAVRQLPRLRPWAQIPRSRKRHR